MKVRVVFLHRAADLVPEDKRIAEVTLPPHATLRDLLKIIARDISRRLAMGILEGRLIFNIMINDESVSNLNIKLRDGDTVRFLTPEMGG